MSYYTRTLGCARGVARPLVEGEADFVVLHPSRGLLVLEVKGGKTIQHDGYRWFRATQHGPREFQDPFKQAQRNMHALLDIARERSGGRIRKRDFVHGYAVVFPHLDYEGSPPPHADKAIIISRRKPTLHGAGDRDRVRGMDR